MKDKKIYIISYIIAIFLIIIAVLTNIMAFKKTTITQLSATTESQMMGYIIKTNNGKLVVIDGGTEGDSIQLEKYINKLGGKVDTWIITHPHKDHVGAFIELMSKKNKFNVSKIYASINDEKWYEKYATRNNEVKVISEFKNIIDKSYSDIFVTPSIDDEIIIDNIKIKIMGIRNEEITENCVNNSSMVFKVFGNKKNVIFLGDTGYESSQKLVNMYKNGELKSDMLQLAHHGQKGGSEELYRLIDPEICLWPNTTWLNVNNKKYNFELYDTEITNEWLSRLNVKKHYFAYESVKTIEL